MPVVARVDPKTVFSPDEWSRLTSRSPWRGLWLVAHAWGTVAAAVALVTLSHSKIHAEDCAECETRVGMLDQIDLVIGMEGALDAEQRKRLMEIADKCPVHRTLTSEIRIVTRAAD